MSPSDSSASLIFVGTPDSSCTIHFAASAASVPVRRPR